MYVALALITIMLNSYFTSSFASHPLQYSKDMYVLRSPDSKEEWDAYHKIRIAEIHNKYCPKLVYDFEDPEEKLATNFGFIF